MSTEEWMGEISIQKILGEVKRTLAEIQTDLIQVKIALGIDNPVLPSQDQIDNEFEKMESDYWQGFDE
jgi:hypothetical protein